MKGYDIKTVSRITSSVHVPVIACGGAGTIGDLKDVFENGRVSAAAVGSFFIYYGNNCAVLINTPSGEDYLRAGIYEFD